MQYDQGRHTEDAHVPGATTFLIKNDGGERVGEEAEEFVLQFDLHAENTVQKLADIVVV